MFQFSFDIFRIGPCGRPSFFRRADQRGRANAPYRHRRIPEVSDCHPEVPQLLTHAPRQGALQR